MASGIPPLLSASPPPMSKIDFSDDEGDNDNEGNDDDYDPRDFMALNSKIEHFSDYQKESNPCLKDTADSCNDKNFSILNCNEQSFKDEIISSTKNNSESQQNEIICFTDKDISSEENSNALKHTRVNFCAVDNNTNTGVISTNDFICDEESSVQKEIHLDETNDEFSTSFETLNEKCPSNHPVKETEENYDMNTSCYKRDIEINENYEDDDRKNTFSENNFFSVTNLNDKQTVSTLEAKIENVLTNEHVGSSPLSCMGTHSDTNDIKNISSNEIDTDDIVLQQNETQFDEYNSSFSPGTVCDTKFEAEVLNEIHQNEKVTNIFDQTESETSLKKNLDSLQSEQSDSCLEYANERIKIKTDFEEPVEDTDNDFFFVTLDANLNSKTPVNLFYNEKKEDDEWTSTFSATEDDVGKTEISFDEFTAPSTFSQTVCENEDEDDFSDFVSPTDFVCAEFAPYESSQIKLQSHPEDVNNQNSEFVDSNQFEFVDLCSNGINITDTSTEANKNTKINSNNNNSSSNSNSNDSEMCCSLNLQPVNISIIPSTDCWNDIFSSQIKEEIEVNVNTIEGKLNSNAVWCRIKDVETSPALNYNWNNSEANKMLLSTLYVDSRNILFGPRWNAEVPRFASNLGFTPLVPQKALSSNYPQNVVESSEKHMLDNQLPNENIETSKSLSVLPSVPDAHFDWNNSGLTNPLDNCKPVKNKENESYDITYGSSIPDMSRVEEVSKEASEILNNLPNLIVMEKQYIVFPIR